MKVRSRAGRVPSLVLLLAVTGCAPIWTRLTRVPAIDTLDRDKRVQVWALHDSVNYWYAVVISHDSVSGRRYQTRGDKAKGRPRLIHSDTTRYSLPLTDVDSVRLGRYNPANTYLLVADLTFIALYTVFSKCHDPLGCT